MQAAQNIVHEAGAAISSPLLPLQLYMEGCATQVQMNENVDRNIDRGFNGIIPYLDQSKGAVSLVGSGPSIHETHALLALMKSDVLAINSAIGYLLKRGIVPKWAMLWDADELVTKFAVPHPDVTYLVAARCHPKVFERLRNCKVVTWFAGGDHNIMEYMEQNGLREPLINGGSAGITRGMYLATALGYRRLNIFGADSCYSDEFGTHVEGSVVKEKEFRVWIGKSVGARSFKTTPEWCAQVNEFRDIYQIFAHPRVAIDVEVFGDGMLAHMWRIMRAKHEKGLLWNADGTPGTGHTPPTQPLEELPNVANACV